MGPVSYQFLIAHIYWRRQSLLKFNTCFDIVFLPDKSQHHYCLQTNNLETLNFYSEEGGIFFALPMPTCLKNTCSQTVVQTGSIMHYRIRKKRILHVINYLLAVLIWFLTRTFWGNELGRRKCLHWCWCAQPSTKSIPVHSFLNVFFFSLAWTNITLCVWVCVCVRVVCMLIAKLFWIKPRTIKTRGILQRKSNATHREFPELGIGAVLTNQDDVKKDVACFFFK